MRKALLFLVLNTTLFFGQEKSKYVYKNETINIEVNKGNLEINSNVDEQKYIAKSKNISDYSESIYYNSFKDISNIRASTKNLKKDKTYYLNFDQIVTVAAESEEIFHSDSKYKRFLHTRVEDNCNVNLAYKITYKNPRLLPVFRFQDDLDVDYTSIKIICDNGIDLGYKLYGLNTDKIKFTKTAENGKDIYTWEMQNVEKLELENDMQNPSFIIPHLAYYVKSYQANNQKQNYLESTQDLYNWYSSLLKETNNRDQSGLKTLTENLIKDAKTDKEKAKIIFEWVQKNLHYVAFEYAMGGFIPRDAADIYEKKYGDCKDMANLIYQMFKVAKLEAGLTWIGTSDKPYAYTEITTPIIDNHMIASAKIDGTRYYFDATDKFCPFLFPSQMIQGKEALSLVNEKEFVVEKVEIISPTKNEINYNFNVKIEENAVKGDVKSTISGLNKSQLLNNLFYNPNKENEIWNGMIANYNPKITLNLVDKNRNEYQESPALVNHTFVLEDWIKKFEGNLIFKPLLLPFFSDNQIDATVRKYTVNYKKANSYKAKYVYEIPENYSVEFLPKNFKLDNDLFSSEIIYQTDKNQITVQQTLSMKKTIVLKEEFENWNTTLKQILKQSTQSIILKNEK